MKLKIGQFYRNTTRHENIRFIIPNNKYICTFTDANDHTAIFGIRKIEIFQSFRLMSSLEILLEPKIKVIKNSNYWKREYNDYI